MEDVLYDLNLVENAINDNYAVFSGDSVRRQQLLDYVFQKHKITEQTFDTSLVWYNAHLDKYLKINENVEKRYAKVLADLLAEDAKIKREAVLIAEGIKLPNFVELPKRDTLRLFPVPVDSLRSDSIAADTMRYYLPLPEVKAIELQLSVTNDNTR
ncbi:hypothetical protein AGMMS4957_03970 [Bacteroidia bacterium]|nr:hypothetical protein AGMMS4957_03970 [Bacteroidia bacterium]